MSQQTPPNHPDEPGHNPYGSAEAPSFAQDSGPAANPYYANQRPASQPNLDEGSPNLTTAEAQRLNRKALLFLGGILVLLMLLGYFVLFRDDDEEPEPAARTTADEVNVPRVPTALPPDLPEDPNDQALMQQPVEPLPVMPDLPQEDPYANDRNRGSSMEPSGPRPPTLAERRMGAAGGMAGQSGGDSITEAGGVTQAAEGQAAQMQALQNAMLGLPPGGVAAATVTEPPTNAQFLSNPQALLVRGTYLRCVLETRIITDIPGFTSCLLTEPVYSVNGRTMLLPKGSKILGRYQDQEDGVPRVAVIWDRIVTPTGMDVTMSSPGVDGLGGAGHPGSEDNHWGQKIASALLISLISDAFSYAAAKNGPETNVFTPGGTVVQQPFQSATARSMERLASDALRKSAQRPSTVTINQGTVVNVYVSKDVDFSSVLATRSAGR